MEARGWLQVDVDDGDWDFIYADVGWIHEHITYTARALQKGSTAAARAPTLTRARACLRSAARSKR